MKPSNAIFGKPWSVPNFLLFIILFAGTAQAANYVFPGNLPSGCSGTGPNYTCGALTLAWNDTLTINSPKPATITFNGNFNVSNAQINWSGSAGDLTLIVNGALSGNTEPRIKANIQVTGNATIVYKTQLAGNLTVGGTLNTGSDSIVTGNVNANGAVTLGYKTTVTGTLTGASIADPNGLCSLNGAVTANTGAIALGYDTRVSGNVSGPAAVTLAGRVKVTGNVNAGTTLDVQGAAEVTGNVIAAGAATTAWASKIGGTTHVGSLTDAGASTFGKSIVANTGSISLGGSSTVAGDVTAASGDVSLGHQTQVNGNVTSATDKIALGSSSRVTGCASTERNSANSITLNWAAQAGGVCCRSSSGCLPTSAACYKNDSGGSISTAACEVATPANLFVDDDKAQCPTATHTKIQDAVNAAANGETITICPGTYAENVNIAAKALTLQSSTGNKADVTIAPTATAGIASNRALTVNNLTIASVTGGVNGINACPVSAATLTLSGVDINIANTQYGTHAGIFQNASGMGCAGLTLNLANVTVINPKKGNGILLNNGAGAHALTNVSVTAADHGYDNLNGIKISGGSSFTATNLDVTYNGNYSTTGNGAALWLQSIAGNISITAPDGNAHAIKTTGGGNYGVYVCPGSAATLTITGANTSAPITVSGTRGKAIMQNTSGMGCAATTVSLANVNATSTSDSGVYIANGAGAHAFDYMTVNSPLGGSGYNGFYLSGGSSAVLTDVDVVDVSTGDGAGGAVVKIIGITGNVTLQKSQKSTVSYTTSKTSQADGLYICRSGSQGTVTVSGATVSAPIHAIRLPSAGLGCATSTANFSNVTATNKVNAGYNAVRIENGGGDHQFSGMNVTSGGWALDLANTASSTLAIDNSTFVSNNTSVGYGAMALANNITGGTVTSSTFQSVMPMTVSTSGVSGLTMTGNTFKTTGSNGNYATLYGGSNSRVTYTDNCIYAASGTALAKVSSNGSLDNGSKGNYWDGWSNTSACGTPVNNICPNQYPSAGGQKDRYPLATCTVGPAAPLVAEYKFDDTWSSTDPLDDSSGKGKNATINGTVTQETAPASGVKPDTCKAGNFNKAGWFATASGLDVNVSSGDKNSVSFWMYWDGGFSSSNFTMPFSWGGVYYDLAVSKYRAGMGNGVIGFNTGNGDVFGVTADGLANGWHHVAAIFNNGDVTQNKLYIDGVQKTLISFGSHSTRSATASAGIGAGAGWGGDYKWSGKLDNLKIYKGEMSAAQITADMAETTPCATQLIADWRMDEAAWNGTADEVKDSGANAKHGVAVNGASTSAGAICKGGDFDGVSNRYVGLPANVQQVAGLTPDNFTMLLWVKPGKTHQIDTQSTNSTTGVSGQNYALYPALSSAWNWDTGGYAGAGVSVGINGISVYEHAGGYMPAVLVWQGAVSSSAWTHVAVVYSDGVPSLYVNGAFVKTGVEGTHSSHLNVVPTYIVGSRGYGNYQGGVDEYKIFSGSLTAAQIAAGVANEAAGKNWDGTDRTCLASGPDHYELSLPTAGVACASVTATVTACADATNPCTNKFVDVSGKTATLAASVGTLSATSVTFDATGIATATLSHPAATDGAAVTVTLSGEEIAASNPRKCCPDGANCVARDNCSVTFSTAGLLVSDSATGGAVTPATQISGKTSGQYYLRAVKTGATTKLCEAAISGTRSVNFSYGCTDPDTCAGTGKMSINGGTAFGPTAAAQSLTFDAGTGAAPFAFRYDDAGKITLAAGPATADNGATLAAATTGPFVVKPAGLCVYSTDLSPCAAADASCAAVRKAGAAFNLTARGVKWESDTDTDLCSANNATTPNYKATGIALGSDLVAPSGGSAGSVGVSTMNIAANGWASVDQTISEVGVFRFTATPPAYFGETIGTPPFKSGALGRFYPDHFDVTVAGNGALATACGSDFTHTGQPMGYATAPSLTIKAMNGLSTPGIATNYTGAFQKLAAADVSMVAPTADASQNGKDGATKTALAATLNAGTLTNSSGTMTYTLGSDSFAYTRDANSLIGPYTAAVRLTVGSVADSDGVTKAASATWPTLAPTGVPLRYGRLRLLNFYGSELLPARVEYRVETWDGSRWATNATDTCSAVAAASVAPGGLTVSTTRPPTYASGVGFITFDTAAAGSHDIAINLNASGSDTSCNASHGGTAANRPWLQGEWAASANCNGTAAWAQDPNARIKLGSPKANYIYLRERY